MSKEIEDIIYSKMIVLTTEEETAKIAAEAAAIVYEMIMEHLERESFEKYEQRNGG